MKRLMLSLLALLASVVLVRADVPVPLPKGKKFVPVKYSVKLDKDISGYLFFTRTLGLRNGNFEKIELSADKAVALAGFGKFGLQLLAVPPAVAGKYPTEKELCAAERQTGWRVHAPVSITRPYSRRRTNPQGTEHRTRHYRFRPQEGHPDEGQQRRPEGPGRGRVGVRGQRRSTGGQRPGGHCRLHPWRPLAGASVRDRRDKRRIT